MNSVTAEPSLNEHQEADQVFEKDLNHMYLISKPKLFKAALKATKALHDKIGKKIAPTGKDERPAQLIRIEKALNTEINFDCNHERVVKLIELIFGHPLYNTRPPYGSSGDGRFKDYPLFSCFVGIKTNTGHSYKKDVIYMAAALCDVNNYTGAINDEGILGDTNYWTKKDIRIATDEEIKFFINKIPNSNLDDVFSNYAAFVGN